MAEPSHRFFSKDTTAQIGRFRIPYPVSVILGILFIPVLLIAGPLSIPIAAILRRRAARKERLLTTEMKACGRLIPWSEARSLVANSSGMFIEEMDSPKSSRIWWTPEDLPAISPHPCYFDEGPDPWEHELFFDWCRSHCTNPEGGTAHLVDVQDNEREEALQALKEFLSARRCVSIWPRLPARTSRTPNRGPTSPAAP